MLDLAYNFNPRTPYGMRRYMHLCIKQAKAISIHAPLTGCDFIYLWYYKFAS